VGVPILCATVGIVVGVRPDEPQEPATEAVAV
jgi:hypothetical protein